MKTNTHTFTFLRWAVVLLATVGLFPACSDDLPGPMDSTDRLTVLKSIKIVNAGGDGTLVVQGTVDEDKKEISFPRIVPETDFSRLRFEIEASDGAKLEQDSYEVPFGTGESEKTIVLKLVNQPRYREYLAKFRLKIPVFGAEFGSPTVYDYSANEQGNPPHDAFAGLVTRGTGFDGEYVLVAHRTSPHLLKVSDLMNNQVDRIDLNRGSVVTGGTFPVNGGAQVNGHSYLSSLSGSAASPLKIYHWANPADLPDVIANISIASLPGAGLRHGDNVSFNLDDSGNGHIFFISQQGPILRLKVSDYTTVTEPTVLTAAATYGQWSSILQVGSSGDYLLTGNGHPISVTDASASPSYTMATSSVPRQGVDARVAEFNGERYLIMVTAARIGSETTTLYVYNITNGSSIAEALANFEQTDRTPLYQYTLSSATSVAPASQTGFKVLKDADGNDETLRLFAAAADAGFAIIDFPKKIAEED